MPFTSDDDVAAFAKQREHAYCTRLAGLIVTLMLVLALVILPTVFKSHEITGMTRSDSCLLAAFNLCGLTVERDKCPDDPDKDKLGVCGCGVPDTDTDGDGTPDCKDACPHDALKTSPQACGCDIPDTDTDGDWTPDCKDGCPHDALKMSPGVCDCGIPDNDPSILSICANRYPNGNCEGCVEKYYRAWDECHRCLSGIKYCITYSFEDRYKYVDSLKNYVLKIIHQTIIQSGADSSKSTLVYNRDCNIIGNCVENII